MTLHEQISRAEIIAAQTALLNDTLALVPENASGLKADLVAEILRLSQLIK